MGILDDDWDERDAEVIPTCDRRIIIRNVGSAKGRNGHGAYEVCLRHNHKIILAVGCVNVRQARLIAGGLSGMRITWEHIHRPNHFRNRTEMERIITPELTRWFLSLRDCSVRDRSANGKSHAA